MTWHYTTPGLHGKWRAVRYDSDPGTSFVKRLEEVIEGAKRQVQSENPARYCLITTPRDQKMRTAAAISADEAEGYERGSSGMSWAHQDPVTGNYRPGLRGNSLCYDPPVILKRNDVEWLRGMEVVRKKKEHADNFATSLDQLLSGLMGMGMAVKSQTWDKYHGTWSLELEYEDLDVTIVNKREER